MPKLKPLTQSARPESTPFKPNPQETDRKDNKDTNGNSIQRNTQNSTPEDEKIVKEEVTAALQGGAAQEKQAHTPGSLTQRTLEAVMIAIATLKLNMDRALERQHKPVFQRLPAIKKGENLWLALANLDFLQDGEIKNDRIFFAKFTADNPSVQSLYKHLEKQRDELKSEVDHAALTQETINSKMKDFEKDVQNDPGMQNVFDKMLEQENQQRQENNQPPLLTEDEKNEFLTRCTEMPEEELIDRLKNAEDALTPKPGERQTPTPPKEQTSNSPKQQTSNSPERTTITLQDSGSADSNPSPGVVSKNGGNIPGAIVTSGSSGIAPQPTMSGTVLKQSQPQQADLDKIKEHGLSSSASQFLANASQIRELRGVLAQTQQNICNLSNKIGEPLPANAPHLQANESQTQTASTTNSPSLRASPAGAGKH